jgi:hypothetical protein
MLPYFSGGTKKPNITCFMDELRPVQRSWDMREHHETAKKDYLQI